MFSNIERTIRDGVILLLQLEADGMFRVYVIKQCKDESLLPIWQKANNESTYLSSRSLAGILTIMDWNLRRQRPLLEKIFKLRPRKSDSMTRMILGIIEDVLRLRMEIEIAYREDAFFLSATDQKDPEKTTFQAKGKNLREVFGKLCEEYQHII